MKIIKISALWCSGCLLMNKMWKNIEKNENIETISLDYDFDEEEVQKYNPGKILPVFIFEKDNKEVKRIIGETTEEEINKVISEVVND